MISKLGENLVFLLGIPRSGTTLLSVMLDGHSMVRCPPEPWLMLALESLGRVPARSPADAPVLYRAFREFCDPAHAIVAARQYAAAAYNQAMTASGKKILVDKTPRYYLILSYLTEVFPNARFIILWRNPLDIAASMRTTWQIDIARELSADEDHLQCIDLVVGLRRLLDFSRTHAKQVHTLQYERLVHQPQRTLNVLSKWLKLPIEAIGKFELGGGDFDRGDIGDKKILVTRGPHKKSIGKWKETFSSDEVATIVRAIGPHLFTAIGYDDVLAGLSNTESAAGDPTYSNAYAARLEQSLARRNSEYESVETFGDFTAAERRLHGLLLGSSLPSQPISNDLKKELQRASESAQRLIQNVERLQILEQQLADASARLEESRGVVQQQTAHTASRESEWSSTTAGLQMEIAQHRSQVTLLNAHLKTAREQLERTAADHSVQCQAIAAISSELQIAQADLRQTTADLASKREQSEGLSRKLVEAESQNQTSTAELMAAYAEKASLTQQLGLTQQNLDERTTSLGERTKSLDEQTLRLEQQAQQLEVALRNLAAAEHSGNEKTASLAEKMAALKATGEALDDRTRELESSIKSLETTSDALATTRQDLQLAQATIAAEQLETRALSTLLTDARMTIDQLRLAPANRRAWPYAAPETPPLPATLPGGKPWPKISIVTASFNQGCYIEQTILSVLNQNYPNLEYILIDGGSTDQTMSVVNRYRHRISFVVSEKDNGQSHAINKGMARASGELLTWINSDDMLESGALTAMAMAFHTSGADMVAGVCTLHTGGVVASRHMTACTAGPLPIEDLLDLDHCWLRGQFFYQPEVMFTRDLWNRSGGYLDESLYYSMDYDLWLRFALEDARLHVIGRPIAMYRVHENQKTFRMEDYKPELMGVRTKYTHNGGNRDHHRKSNGRSGLASTHLRVLFFNDLGGVGGAGIAHQRLAASFAIAGHVVMPLAISPNLTDCQLSNDQILQAITDRTPDVVFLGNIHSARLDPALIGLIADRWPTVQVMHDLYSLTGRCAYTGNCDRFLTGCDEACPTSGEYPTLAPELIFDAWTTKKKAMTGENPPILAAVSRWTQAFAHHRFSESASSFRSPEAPDRLMVNTAVAEGTRTGLGLATRLIRPPVSLKTVPIRKPTVIGIRYGVPTEAFKPRDKSSCRDVLKLPQDRFIVLFSSTTLSDRRKGLDHLVAALESLNLPDLLAVCIGQPDAALDGVKFEIRAIGYVTDVDSLAVVYSAADLFVGPSLVETFGQVFIEAAASGTPSVGYAAAGGVEDALADGISGLLAPVQTPGDLARQIGLLYDDPGLRRDMAVWGRLWVENEFSYKATYQRIFAALNQIGLLDRLHLPPKVTFLEHRQATTEVVYLVPPPPIPTESQLLAEAQARLAVLQAEGESLRGRARELEISVASLSDITHTRLWRMVAAVYPHYERIAKSTTLPDFATWPVRTIGEWFAERGKTD